ncbi:hypothetical protein H310_06176 [Aphanomyces invadans]|uniref:Mitochondrial fission process protein 1 n=1 Tax=Aphanomyces invadans TaxID=157072 RepID=A0A024U6K5_9STRA|nr:hypothetical protein H310_06176 [Aphanomyces invadans]ETW01512.1 hypothetical protein H310_06176 [Aphanomyces invadans]|eukprot:XP_008869360.1 hypothetical protein H310_06176 [Aphanomyces invadans]
MTNAERSAPFDVWRDSPLRYLGYANELGESFRPLFPRAIAPSYVVAIGYVIGDTIDKGMGALNEDPSTQPSSALGRGDNKTRAVKAALDTLIWQGFASVAIPGVVINRVVAASAYAISKQAKATPAMLKWGPTCIGLGVIPFIIHPIDNFVDFAMDRTTRVWSRDI